MLREIAILKIDALFGLMCTTDSENLKRSRYDKLRGYADMAEYLGVITVKERAFVISAAIETLY